MVHGNFNIPQKVASLVRPGPADESKDSNGTTTADEPTPPPAPPTFPYYAAGSTRRRHEELNNKMVDLILRKGVFFNSRDERRKSPYNFRRPEVLERMMDFKLGKEPLVGDDPSKGLAEILKIMEFVLDYSPHPSHPFMVHKDSAGLDPYGILGDWLANTMSQPVLTYILSPVFTLMEYEVEEKFRNLIGYPANQGDGMVTPGQGIGNSYAIQLALQNKFLTEDVKHKGLYQIGNPKPVMLVSEQGDYGYEKYCVWEGIGENACVRVKSDSKGRMDVGDLKKKINEAKTGGSVPFLIVATAGTNVLGAIDPIDDIANIASQESCWYHVDGHLSGSCVFSSKHKQRLKGIEKSDSCLWSPSKMLAAPFCTTIIVTKETNKMKKTFSYDAAVVFSQDPFYDHDKWDNGDNTMQTTRRPDILKIWYMWKAKGCKGLADQVDGTYENARICLEELKKRKGRFELVLQECDSNLVCFYYIPELVRLHGMIGGQDRILRILRSNKVTENTKNRLLDKGKMEISIGELPNRKDLPKFFVMNMNNTALTRADISYMLDLIEYHGDLMLIWNPVRAEDSVDATLLNEVAMASRDRSKLAIKEPSVPDPPASYPDHVSAPIESMHKDMFVEYFKVAFDIGTYFQDKRNESPYHAETPEDLLQKFDFSLDTSCGESSGSSYKTLPELMKIVKDVIYYSPHLGHPYFAFQLVAGLDPYTLMADYVVTCMSSPMYTYEDGPVFTLMEDELTKATLSRTKQSKGTGISFVGGSISNQLPVCLAYVNKVPQSKMQGNLASGAQGVIFCSEGAHYATPKAAYFQGIGQDNCYLIKCDATGKMDPQALRDKVTEAKQKGQIPIMVCATAGTTTLGAYDPVDAIADICAENQMWLHIDGAYGGSVVLSDKEISRIKAIEMADSFTLNPHKMMCAARYTTVWVSKHEDILWRIAPPPSKQHYRLNPDLYNGEKYDHGETHPLTDRRADVFKMWLLWKAKGQRGLQEHVDKAYRLTEYAQSVLMEKYNSDKRFQPLLQTPPECTNINFTYVPSQMLTMDQSTENYRKHVECVQNAILGTGIFRNKLVASVEHVNDFSEHLIFCLYNSCLTKADVDYFFKLIEYFGERLNLDQLFQACDAGELGAGSEG